jgi:hypothetical protein
MEQEKKVNGINVDQLYRTIEQIKRDPEIAQFKFRAMNTWIDGTHNGATVKDFYGALKEDTSKKLVVGSIYRAAHPCTAPVGWQHRHSSAGG